MNLTLHECVEEYLNLLEILIPKEPLKWNYRMLMECLVCASDGKREMETQQQKQEKLHVAAQLYLT